MAKDPHRFTPDSSGRISYERRHRYSLFMDVVADREVLHLACGEGFGSEILASRARHVVGVDLDNKAVDRAAHAYKDNQRLEFKVAGWTALPFKDASFDVVVAFDAMEHITPQAEFISEASRVLKKNGVFLVSIPNKAGAGNADAGGARLKLLEEEQFRELLGRQFKQVVLLGQRFYTPSVIGALDAVEGEAKSAYAGLVARADEGATEGGVVAIEDPDYFIALCSHAPMRRRLVLPSVFIDEADDLYRDQEALAQSPARVPDAHVELHAAPVDDGAGDSETEDDDHPANTEILRALDNERVLLSEVKLLAAHTHRLIEGDVLGSLSRLASDLVERSDALAVVQAEAERLRFDLESVEASLGRAEELASDLSGHVAALSDEKKAVERELGEVKHALEQSRRAYFGLEDDLARQSKELVAEREEKIAVNQQLGVQQEVLTAKAAALAVALDEAKAGLTAKEEEISFLRKELAVLGKDVARAREAADLEKKSKESMRAETDALYEEIVRLESVAAELTNEAADAQAELEKTNALLDKRSETLLADRRTLKRIEEQSRIVALKQATSAQLTAAERKVRIRMGHAPLGLFFDRGALRSSIPSPTAGYRLSRAERRDVEYSGLFDVAWYLEQNPDVAAHRVDPQAHFLSHGLAEERDPHPLFSNAWYRTQYADELKGLPPFLHFLRNRSNSPHPLFDPRFYQNSNKDIGALSADPLAHFLRHGALEQRDPHPLVSIQRLSNQVGFSGSKNPLLDYLLNPDLHLASPHPLFDGDFYLFENEDVARQNVNPLLHYCAIGWRQGRQPHRLFPGDWYLANNTDVLALQCNPLDHFVRHGAAEERAPHPLFDVAFYLNNHRDARRSSYDALSHYVTEGAKERSETTGKISVEDMRQIVPQAYWQRFDPISAFVYFGQTTISVPSHVGQADFDIDRPLASAWPPIPDPVYWLPQKLRDYIIARYGEAHIPLFLYLMSIVDRYGDMPEAFMASDDLGILTERLRKFSKRRRKRRKNVDVSIIIPVYNNLVFTLTCVLTILENATRFSFEIIIGDDRSTDATHEIFSSAGSDIRVVRHDANLGFLGNCNACAETANGRFVVFLNNDTLTFPGWLDELIAPMEDDPQIGLTGSKLLNGDGTLQEAGGIFWRDGSAWNFGRNGDPAMPEFNYCKDVDYISGASIALPTSLWQKLEGFDRIFTPAYCEDADIAFRVRQAGLRTLYVPHSELVHHEGKSHGRDTSGGIKAYQVVNMEKLLERWRGTLEAEHFPNAEEVFLARDRSRAKPHILFVDHYIPQWDRDAGSRCMYHYIRMFLASGFHVTFWPDNLNEDREYCAHLQKIGVEVIYSAAYVDRFENFMAANGRYFSYALLSRPHIAIKYYDAIRAHAANCKILYWGVDLHFKRMELELETNSSPDLLRAIEETRAQEADNWRQADVSLYPNVDEREEVRRLAPDRRAEQVPLYGYTDAELASSRANLAHFDARNVNDLVFVGGTHPPNVDALLWFANEILPLVLREQPSTKLHIVGSAISADVARLESDAIVVHGRLSDDELAALYKTAGVAVIPLRFGGGVKGKTVEALLNAIPFVTTPVGLQGLAPGEPICFVADEAEAFAKAVINAQNARDEARVRVLAGLDFLEQTFSLNALRDAFREFMPELGPPLERVEEELTEETATASA